MSFRYIVGGGFQNQIFDFPTQNAIQSHEENKKELETELVKQRALVEDVKKAVEIAGSDSDRKLQLEQLKKKRTEYTEKIRSLSELNRSKIHELSEEITPSLNTITRKIKAMENSSAVKLEVGSFALPAFLFFLKKVNSVYSCSGQTSIKSIKQWCGYDRTKINSNGKYTSL